MHLHPTRCVVDLSCPFAGTRRGSVGVLFTPWMVAFNWLCRALASHWLAMVPSTTIPDKSVVSCSKETLQKKHHGET